MTTPGPTSPVSAADPLPADDPHRASLGMWDTVSLIVGIVVGVSIFRAPALVFGNVSSPAAGLFLWGLGAVLALCGALCYSELATMYPQFGADYVYLTRAYGRRLGFLFAWMQTCAILTGSIGAMAFVFADYAAHMSPLFARSPAATAAAAVVVLCSLQLRGVRTGKLVQNLLTLSKVLALGLLLLAGLFLSSSVEPGPHVEPPEPASLGSIGLALVFVLYAYGGWSDSATVTPEVRNHQKNMPRALLIALAFIGVLYVAINAAYLNVLGFDGLRNSHAPAADVVERTLGTGGSWVMSLTVMISALGAIHGMLFAGCRLLLAVGRDVPLFAAWSRRSSRGAAVWSLLTLTSVSLVLVLAVGTRGGRWAIEWMVERLTLTAPDWDRFGGGFGALVTATAPFYWTFVSCSAAAVIVLRFRDPLRPRPFRVPGYPVPPLLFLVMAVSMLWSSVSYAGRLTLLLMPAFLAGIVIAEVQVRRSESARAAG